MEDEYKVKVLVAINPQLIWVKTAHGLQQLGLYGLFPKVDDDDVWCAKAVALIKDLLFKSVETYFLPLVHCDWLSLFDSIPVAFGNIKVKLDNGNLFILNNLLTEQNLARLNDRLFKFRLSQKKRFLSYPDEKTVKNVKLVIFNQEDDRTVDKNIFQQKQKEESTRNTSTAAVALSNFDSERKAKVINNLLKTGFEIINYHTTPYSKFRNALESVDIKQGKNFTQVLNVENKKSQSHKEVFPPAKKTTESPIKIIPDGYQLSKPRSKNKKIAHNLYIQAQRNKSRSKKDSIVKNPQDRQHDTDVNLREGESKVFSDDCQPKESQNLSSPNKVPTLKSFRTRLNMQNKTDSTLSTVTTLKVVDNDKKGLAKQDALACVPPLLDVSIADKKLEELKFENNGNFRNNLKIKECSQLLCTNIPPTSNNTPTHYEKLPKIAHNLNDSAIIHVHNGFERIYVKTDIKSDVETAEVNKSAHTTTSSSHMEGLDVTDIIFGKKKIISSSRNILKVPITDVQLDSNSEKNEVKLDNIKSLEDMSDPELTISDNEDNASSVTDQSLPNKRLLYPFTRNSFCSSTFSTKSKDLQNKSDAPHFSNRSDDLNLNEERNSDEDFTVVNVPFVQSFCREKIAEELIYQMKIPKLMLHYRVGKPTDRCLNFNTSSFSVKLLNNLKFKDVMSSQTAIWPAAMRGHGIIAVGPHRSGKTFSLLVPICSKILDSTVFESLPKVVGPKALIICPSSSSARYTEDICKSLLNNALDDKGKNIRILRIDSNLPDMENVCYLSNGCDILISSPDILKFTTYKYSGLELDRLAFLVFENADQLDKDFYKDSLSIFKMCMDVLKKRSEDEVQIQVLVASLTWCNLTEWMAKNINNSVVCINAFQECLLYSKTNINVHFILNKEKALHLSTNLKENLTNKAVIICNNNDEVLLVSNSLDRDIYRVITVNITSTLLDNDNAHFEWNKSRCSNERLILVCCDCNLAYLYITDARHLIHYSLPRTYSMFYDRFSVLIDTYPRIWNPSPNSSGCIDLYIDENSNDQLPKLLNIFSRSRVQLSEQEWAQAKMITNLSERKKAINSIPICEELLGFGKCSKLWRCHLRHSVFQEHDDLQDWIPKMGYIKFKILHIHNAFHYSARLLEHTTLNGKVTQFTQDYLNFAFKMALYYADKNNLKLHDNPKVGDVCAAELRDKHFQRCLILKSGKNTGSTTVVVKLIDQEMNINCQLDSLFCLPEEFKVINNHVIQVRFAGLMPKDKDTLVISNVHTKTIKELFDNGKNLFMRGKIVLGLGNTLWLEVMQLCQNLESRNRIIVKRHIKNELIQRNIAIENPNHLPALYEMCKGTIVLPEYTREVKPKSEKQIINAKVSWSNMECDKIHEGFFCTAVSPDSFFIRLKYDVERMELLTKEIQYYSNNASVKKELFAVGDYCISKFSDDKFYRARIEEVNEYLYRCFFVDFGDYMNVEHNQVFPITSDLITRLSFQAIECRFLGIKPTGDTWTESSIDFLYDSCYDGVDEDILKILHIKPILREKSNVTGGSKFAIVLFNNLMSNNISVLNNVFVLKCYAEYLSTETDLLKDNEKAESPIDDKHKFNDFNVVDFNVSGDENSDDDEWEICFDGLDYLTTKYAYVADAEPDLFDQCYNKRSHRKALPEPQIVEVPDSFKNDDLSKVFDDKTQ